MPDVKGTKERILEVAADLFSREGYSAVSIRDITREVGIKESSLYNHFSSKEQILERILSDFEAEYRKILPPREMLDAILARTTPPQFLMQGFLNFKERLTNPAVQRMWRVLHMEQYRHPRARQILLHNLIGETIELMEDVFARWIAQGKVKPLDPRALAASYQYPVFSMTTEWSLLSFAGEDTAEAERRMTDHIKLFFDLIKPS